MGIKNLIPNFIMPKKSKSSSPSSPSSSSSSSSPFSSLAPPSQSIKAKKKNSPSSKHEVVHVDIPILSTPSPSTPSLPPSSFSSSVVKSELELAFRKFDADGDGRISPLEVRALLRCMGDEATEEEATHMVREADTNGDGFMDLHEFIDLIMRPSKPHSPPLGEIRALEEEEEELQCAFKLFDKDENGFISAEELHEMLQNLGEREVSLQDCHQMIHNVDYNNDGVVDFEEFKAMMIVNVCA